MPPSHVDRVVRHHHTCIVRYATITPASCGTPPSHLNRAVRHQPLLDGLDDFLVQTGAHLVAGVGDAVHVDGLMAAAGGWV